MEIHVTTSNKDWFKVKFSEKNSGLEFVVGIAIPVVAKWNIQTNQLLPTATVLADELLLAQIALVNSKDEYLFTTENTGNSLENTVDNIRNSILQK